MPPGRDQRSSGLRYAAARLDCLNPRPSYKPKSAVRVLRVDPEHSLGHPCLAEPDQGCGGDGSRQSAPTPRPADADVLEPATLDTEALVLLGPDPVLDDARDLVAVPGDDPQVRVELRPRERARERRLGHLAVTPVVAERLVLGLEDGPPLRLLDRPDLETLGQRGIRDLIQAVAAHQEEVAYRLEPGLGEERPVADGGVLDPRGQLDRDVRILAGRAHLRPLDAPVEQPASDPAPSVVGVDLAFDLVHRGVVPDHPLDTA